MHMFHFGTNLELERMVSQGILKYWTLNRSLTIIVILVLMSSILLVQKKFKWVHRRSKLYLLCPILALCLCVGLQWRIERKLTHGFILYEFGTVQQDGTLLNTVGEQVSTNNIKLVADDTYIITNTTPKLIKMTDAQKQRLTEIQLTGGLE